ncbi:hypothetical protein [Streptomyces sp. CBMA123]|uniref:hypothetical protein n=1 Tax=Streptomyces sp. CBMA123 TaxID=1896313 RepID=UPI001661BD36|nr:hypothetical protein [Streptomyces sp. CBMA123]MBD0688779.1 hypothetical protein [Streptomyces sp. CBMA123]
MADGSTGKSDGDGGSFALKPWELHGEGREFEKLGRELGKAVGTLEKDLAALGTPWGTDQPGSAFAAVYGPAHGELLGGLKALAGQVGGVGTGLHTMAERTTDTDTSTADGFGGGPRPATGPAARPAVYAVPAATSGPGATPGAAPAVPTDMSV